MQDPHDTAFTKEMAMNSLDSVTRYQKAAESGFEFHRFFQSVYSCVNLLTHNSKYMARHCLNLDPQE